MDICEALYLKQVLLKEYISKIAEVDGLVFSVPKK